MDQVTRTRTVNETLKNIEVVLTKDNISVSWYCVDESGSGPQHRRTLQWDDARTLTVAGKEVTLPQLRAIAKQLFTDLLAET